MEKDNSKEYTNGEVTIVWKPDVCIHSANCVNGLPQVFDAQKKPWINAEGADTQAIIAQVNKCPSGALSYYLNEEAQEAASVQTETIVEVSENGPVLVYGNLRIKDHQGNETVKTKVTAFCRCGASSNKPFCDGTHRKIGFQG
jgi:uncharacterized Fe-S cluster protein YjdI